MKQSIWHDALADVPERGPLVGERKTHVLVIGGGMAGLLTAYMLKKKGADCLLLEAGRVCSGNTGRTTAKITAQHGLIYARLIRQYGALAARRFYEANTAAAGVYRALAEEIDCDYEEKTAYVYSTDDRAALEEEAAAYVKLRIPHTWREDPPLPVRACGALGMPQQAQFHPLKLVRGILPELDYHENTFVTDIQGRRALTRQGAVTAEHIVLATHYPMVNVPGLYFLKLHQSRSYVVGLEGGPDVDGMYIDKQAGGLSLRNYGDMLLLGGGGHKTGKPGGGWAALREVAQRAYPGAEIRCEWAAQDCMSRDGMPYIGAHRKSTPYLHVATGFNKWGMTGSMLAATMLARQIETGTSPCAGLFWPRRSMLHPALFSNIGTAALHLLKPGKRCAHMGCSLHWNEAEQSWDCPCHGSRFDSRGRLTDNPAKRGISIE